ncbi:MAG: hypothetical protein WC683_20610, partial [bacterium]
MPTHNQIVRERERRWRALSPDIRAAVRAGLVPDLSDNKFLLGAYEAWVSACNRSGPNTSSVASQRARLCSMRKAVLDQVPFWLRDTAPSALPDALRAVGMHA